MRIAIVFNPPSEPRAPRRATGACRRKASIQGDEAERAVVGQVEAIDSVLRETMHEPLPFALHDLGTLCRFVRHKKPAVIFNCCEAFRGDHHLEMNVAAVIELLGVPYTGSPPSALANALDKGVAKSLLRAHHVPTPRALVAYDPYPATPSPLRFPVIVKPLRHDASIGIDDGAVVLDDAALRRRVQWVHHEFRQPALVEEYVDGRELNVAVLGGPGGALQALPISEISFEGMPAGAPHIVGYEAKWLKSSPWFRATVPQCPATLPTDLRNRVAALALTAARALGVRDYARVDMRLRARDQRPFVIEVNPNPDLGPDAGFARAALASGRTYARTILDIVAHATARWGSPGSARATPAARPLEVA